LNNQPHIVFFTPGFPESEKDSLCIPALQIFMKALKKQFKGKLSIISFQYPYKENNYQWNGIDVYALGGNNSRLKKRLTWQKAKQVFELINKKNPVTKVHSFWMGECAFVASKMAVKYNLSHNCTLMGQDVLEGNSYFEKTKKVNHFITLSSFHKQQLLTNYNINSIEIPWGITKVENKHHNKTVDIIGVGALTTLKCYDEFIDAINCLKDDYPNLTSKVVGEGPLRNELQQKINELGLTDNIALTGLLDYDKTQELIAKSKVLLHLSNFESFGMVTIEAIANQTKVVAKPVGIANDIDEVIKVNGMGEAVKELKLILEQDTTSFNDLFNYNIENTVLKYIELFNE
jgi:glycosyltransferase involved in cell wall biosynthesis